MFFFQGRPILLKTNDVEHKYGQLIFDRGAKEMECSKYNSFQQMVLEQPDTHMQKNKSRHRPCTHHKN